jgi:hypothetical protein
MLGRREAFDAVRSSAEHYDVPINYVGHAGNGTTSLSRRYCGSDGLSCRCRAGRAAIARSSAILRALRPKSAWSERHAREQRETLASAEIMTVPALLRGPSSQPRVPARSDIARMDFPCASRRADCRHIGAPRRAPIWPCPLACAAARLPSLSLRAHLHRRPGAGGSSPCLGSSLYRPVGRPPAQLARHR